MESLADTLQTMGMPHMASSLDAVCSTLERFASVEFEGEVRLALKSVPGEVKADSDVEEISQGFIAKSGDSDVRIRKTVVNSAEAETTYTLTAKHRPLSQESEMVISKEMFDALWAVTSSQMRKTRYKWNGWDIDEFPDGKVVAEYEYEEGAKEVVVPPELSSVILGKL